MTRGLRLALIVVVVLPVTGCATTPTTSTDAEPDTAPARDGERLVEADAARRAGPSRALIATEPRGFIPYDNFSLPVVGPRGDVIATRSGAAPDWDAILASPGATVPRASRIEIYALPPDQGAPRLAGVVDDSALLGRSCDAGGFVVESPRDDGARWIGVANWSSGAIDWRVSDDRVNAFASLAPDRRLAWSRLDEDGESFDLVVETTGGAPWTLPGDGGDWLMPTWSGAGAGLYVLGLRNGFLDLFHGDGSSFEQFRDSAQRTPLGTGADRGIAYQVLSGQIATPSTHGDGRLLFYHPVRRCMAVWDASASATPTLLDPGSFNGALDGAHHVLVASPGELHRRAISDAAQRLTVIEGLHIPRPLTGSEWNYMLLGPGTGGIEITSLAVVSE